MTPPHVCESRNSRQHKAVRMALAALLNTPPPHTHTRAACAATQLPSELSDTLGEALELARQLEQGVLSAILSQGEEQQAPFVRALGLGVRFAAALADEQHPIDAAWLTATTAALVTLQKLSVAALSKGTDIAAAAEACIPRTGA